MIEYNYKTKLEIFKFFIKTFPKYSCFLFFSLLIVGLLEAIGIIGLLPVMEIILKENQTSSVAEFLKEFFKIFDIESDVINILVFILIIFALKAIIQTFIMYKVSHITSKMVHNFRINFLNNLVSAEWNFFISKPNGRFVNAMLIECKKAASCLIAICRVLETFIRVILLLFAGFAVNLEIVMLSFIAVIILSIPIMKFLKISRNASQRSVNQNNNLSIYFSEILQNIKALKVMNLQHRLVRFLSEQSINLYKSYALQTFIKNCISIVKEPIIVFFIAIIIIISENGILL